MSRHVPKPCGPALDAALHVVVRLADRYGRVAQA
jgi:hypothetical protein